MYEASFTVARLNRTGPIYGCTSHKLTLPPLPSCISVRCTCVSRAAHCLDDRPDQSFPHLLSASWPGNKPAPASSSFFSEGYPDNLTIKFSKVLFRLLRPIHAGGTVPVIRSKSELSSGMVDIFQVGPVCSQELDKPCPPFEYAFQSSI